MKRRCLRAGSGRLSSDIAAQRVDLTDQCVEARHRVLLYGIELRFQRVHPDVQSAAMSCVREDLLALLLTEHETMGELMRPLDDSVPRLARRAYENVVYRISQYRSRK